MLLDYEGSGFDDRLEPAVGHALAVKGHRALLRHAGQTRVRHDLGVDFVAMFARLEDDPCKDHRLVKFTFNDTRERHLILYIQVIANAFPILEGAVFPPDLARLLCDFAVAIDLVLRDW